MQKTLLSPVQSDEFSVNSDRLKTCNPIRSLSLRTAMLFFASGNMAIAIYYRMQVRPGVGFGRFFVWYFWGRVFLFFF